MQRAAANVAIDPERSTPGTGERESEVGGNQRLAVTLGGARYAEYNWSVGGKVVSQAKTEAAKRLDGEGHRLDSKFAAPVRLELRHGAGDCQPQVIRRLLWITEPAIERIVEDGGTDRKRETGKHGKQQEARCIIGCRE